MNKEGKGKKEPEKAKAGKDKQSSMSETAFVNVGETGHIFANFNFPNIAP